MGIGGDRDRSGRGIGSSRGRAGSAVGQSVKLFDVCRAVYPTNSPHVGHPDFLSSFCGLDGEREEGDGVSEDCKGSGERD